MTCWQDCALGADCAGIGPDLGAPRSLVESAQGPGVSICVVCPSPAIVPQCSLDDFCTPGGINVSDCPGHVPDVLSND